MQDVCINYIRNDWTNDMISKVTDICCTDPNDPSCCATPNDIKIDRKKALVLYGFSGKEVTSVPELSGNSYPEPVNWIFSKCWAEVRAILSRFFHLYIRHQANQTYNVGHRPTNLRRQLVVTTGSNA